MRKPATMLSLLVLAASLVVAGTAGASRHAGTFKYCTDPTFPPMELATASGKITPSVSNSTGARPPKLISLVST